MFCRKIVIGMLKLVIHYYYVILYATNDLKDLMALKKLCHYSQCLLVAQ